MLVRLCSVAAMTAFALLWLSSGVDGRQDCTYRAGSDSDGGCFAYCPNPADCCSHEHLTLSWVTCEQPGDMKFSSTSTKFFTAITRGCNQQCPVVGNPAPCSHFVSDCFVVNCPG